MAEIIGVKFRNSGKVYYFSPKKEIFKKGEGVVVETARGVEYGIVSIPNTNVEEDKIVQPLKSVIRKATEKDIEKHNALLAKIPETKKAAEEKIAERKLKMKLIDAEYTFDGSKVVFYFTAAGRVDFRELVKDLAALFHIRIELRQVGIRDETRILGGIAPCGRVCCCAGCLPDFKKVTIKMAKVQGLSLNPGKISGLCGRLMCCLEYENDYYAEAYKKMPKIGSMVSTPDGKGMVIGNNMLKFTVKVKIENGDGSLIYKEFPLADIKFKRGNAPDDVQLTKEEQEELKNLESD
ncbi:MAG TPA: stage 0 sporulation protein [Clostridiales bacterium]|nr:stage 0 sporulation protein [Clostridiales bacterium]